MRQIEGSDAAAFAALFYTKHLFEHIDGAEGAEERKYSRFPCFSADDTRPASKRL